MKFIIRDDDLNYFSHPASMKKWYGDILAQEIPVGFAVVPFIKPISDAYLENIEPEDKEYPISANRELVEYVRDNPSIEILQHGYNHETINGIYEYMDTEADLYSKTVRGKQELERTFGQQVSVFVPPHDDVCKSGIRSIERNNMNILRGRGSLRGQGDAHIISLSSWESAMKIFLHRVYHMARVGKDMVPAYPHVITAGAHKEAFTNRIEAGRKALFYALHHTHKKGGNFVITNHINTLNDVKKQVLLELIYEARLMGADFIKPSELFL